MFVRTNPNPSGSYAEDCVVRAISIASGKSLDDIYLALCMEGFRVKNMPSTKAVWGRYLTRNGFSRHMLWERCPVCYSVRDFCREYGHGIYILETGTHVVAVINGCYCDAWDSGDEMPVEVWRRD